MTTMAPAPVFDHLLRLTDRRGTLEHARFAEPLPEHGYCTDDVARVLVVATRDHGPDRVLNGLQRNHLRNVLPAVPVERLDINQEGALDVGRVVGWS